MVSCIKLRVITKRHLIDRSFQITKQIMEVILLFSNTIVQTKSFLHFKMNKKKSLEIILCLFILFPKSTTGSKVSITNSYTSNSMFKNTVLQLLNFYFVFSLRNRIDKHSTFYFQLHKNLTRIDKNKNIFQIHL